MTRWLAAVLLFCAVRTFAQPDQACDKPQFEALVASGERAEIVIAACRAYLLDSKTRRDAVLSWVVGQGDVHLVEMILNLGYTLDAQEDSNLLFDTLGSSADPVEMEQLLLSRGLDVDRAQNEFHIVYHAIELRFPRTLDLLLRHLDGGVLHEPINLFAAVNAENITVLKTILAHGADVNYVENELAVTPLMVAAHHDAASEVLLTLIKHGADCRRTDRAGNSALSLAKSERVSELLGRECPETDH